MAITPIKLSDFISCLPQRRSCSACSRPRDLRRLISIILCAETRQFRLRHLDTVEMWRTYNSSSPVVASVYRRAFAKIVKQMPSAIASTGIATMPKISATGSVATHSRNGLGRGSFMRRCLIGNHLESLIAIIHDVRHTKKAKICDFPENKQALCRPSSLVLGLALRRKPYHLPSQTRW
jgi:hypothetical protein